MDPTPDPNSPPTGGQSSPEARCLRALLFATLVGLAPACSAPPTPAEAPSVATARLVLKLDGLWGPRRLQYAAPAPRVKITIAGPDLATPYEADVDMGPDGEPAALTGIPVGKIRLVTLRPLDLAGHVATGALRVAAPLGSGLTTLGVSRATTLVGDVVAALQATDGANHTQVLSQVSLPALAAAVTGYARSLNAPDPALMDASAIAYAVYHNDGVPPTAAQPGFLRQSGSVVLVPAGWAPNTSAIATLDDPLSQPLALDDDVPHVLGPVAPGSWTLTVTPTTPGLAPLKVPVTVAPAGASRVAISFGTGLARTDIPKPLGAGLAGAVNVAGSESLVVVGGVTTAAAGGPTPTGGYLFGANGLWSPTAALRNGIVDAATTVYQGRLYAFGGLNAAGLLGDVVRFDPQSAEKSGPLGSLPGGRLGWGGAAGAIGDLIYVAGGTVNATPTGATLAFNANAGEWLQAPLPDMPEPRADLAAAVTGGKLYVFGGLKPLGVAFDGPDDGIAQDAAAAFTPGAQAAWEKLPPMPTPRSGAAAVAVNGAIWVIGGAGPHGAPTGAVEVYNPAAKQWSVRPPLQVPRAFAAVGLVAGKIVVAGGIQGPSPLSDQPVAAVEALSP